MECRVAISMESSMLRSLRTAIIIRYKPNCTAVADEEYGCRQLCELNLGRPCPTRPTANPRRCLVWMAAALTVLGEGRKVLEIMLGSLEAQSAAKARSVR